MVPVQMPAWPVSETKMASAGSALVNSVQSRSGRIGSASELASGATSSRQALT